MSVSDGVTFVFIDPGEEGDEPIAIGPFDTEEEAKREARGRSIMGVWSPETWRMEHPHDYGDYSDVQ